MQKLLLYTSDQSVTSVWEALPHLQPPLAPSAPCYKYEPDNRRAVSSDFDQSLMQVQLAAQYAVAVRKACLQRLNNSDSCESAFMWKPAPNAVLRGSNEAVQVSRSSR